MSEQQERFLVTFDSTQGVPVKVERIGEAGELTEVDVAGFLRRLTPGPAAGIPQQIIINIYGGGAQGTPVVEHVAGPPRPPASWGIDTVPKPKPGPRPKPKKEE